MLRFISNFTTFIESSESKPKGASLQFAEQIREISAALAGKADIGAREANAEVLRCIGDWVLAKRCINPSLAQQVAEAHRLVIGNANPAPIFDRLAMGLLYHE